MAKCCSAGKVCAMCLGSLLGAVGGLATVVGGFWSLVWVSNGRTFGDSYGVFILFPLLALIGMVVGAVCMSRCAVSTWNKCYTSRNSTAGQAKI
jgi:uncharacterized membrane protein